MAFNFPDGASNGQKHTASNGVVYRYDGNVWVIDNAGNNASLDARFLNTNGDGIVSGSSQVIPSGTISGSNQLPSGIISGSSQLPSGAVSGSEQITDVITQNYVSQSAAAAGFGSGGGSSRSDATISGSWQSALSSSVYLQQVKNTISGSVNASAISGSLGSNQTFIRTLTAASISGSSNAGASASEISGSWQGALSSSLYLTQVGSTISGSFNVDRLPQGTISGSNQLPSGLISGSNQLPSGIVSGSNQLPSGIISGSGQLPSGIVSGSLQLPSGIVSGSEQLPSGLISGSLQFPSGLISGSTQISESGFVSSSTTNIIEVMTSASYASITPVSGTLYIIQG